MPNQVLALLSIFLCCFVSLHHACVELDHKSLLSFSLNISSSPPLNWSSHDCCLWEGIGCDSNGRVINLSLPSRGLIGSLSPSIWNLTHLSLLNLSHNHLSGLLSIEPFSSVVSLEILDLSYNLLFGKLPSFSPFRYLKTVDLSSNHFDGEIPDMFLKLTGNLASFNVSNNSFVGSIPSSICFNSSCSTVKLLDFSYNDFSGLIPNTLDQCSQLQIFRAGFNNLSGSIPQELYNVVSLQEVSLCFNGLSGPITNDISNLNSLKILDLYANHLTGSIPPNIGTLSTLEKLQLHINNFTGSLPSSLANCTKLATLNLRFNFLGGDLHTFNFSTFVKLRVLDLGNNNFTGKLPPTLYSCQQLTAVRLSYNQFVGQIMPEIIAMKYLSHLALAHNRLTNVTNAINILLRLKNLQVLVLSFNFFDELMPNDFKIGESNGFQNLQVLVLGACGIRGQIPAWLAKLHKLEVLDLSANQISGSIPSLLFSLPSLFYMDLSHNLLSGEFPRVGNLLPALSSTNASFEFDKSYLQLPIFSHLSRNGYREYTKVSRFRPAIYLGNNSISGKIPIQISQLKSLHVLDLSNNNFSGHIPDELSDLSNLEILDLSGNNLTGEISSSLKSLHFLSWFSVADNNLEGSIPSGGQFDTFPVSSFAGNPGLCGSIIQRSCSSEPRTSSQPIAPEESSANTFKYGIIAGVTFGFIIGTASGLLYPLRKLKFLHKFMFHHP